MKQGRLNGILVAMITPFDEDGHVEFEYLAGVVRFLLEKGVHGFFTCGTSGEGALMSIEQRKAVSKAIVDEVASRVPVVVHAGAITTDETVALAKHADDIGAQAVGVVSPYYFHPDPDGLVEHYRTVAEAVSIPVFVYNIPGCTGFNITPDIMRRLLEIGNVMGFKDSSGRLDQIQEIMRTAPKPIIAINGSDGLLFSSLMIGTDAQISGSANVVPELMVGIYEHCRKGEYKKALSLQNTWREVMRVVFSVRLPSANLKTALELRGVKAGIPKRPLRPMKAEEVSIFKEKLKALNLYW